MHTSPIRASSSYRVTLILASQNRGFQVAVWRRRTKEGRQSFSHARTTLALCSDCSPCCLRALSFLLLLKLSDSEDRSFGNIRSRGNSVCCNKIAIVGSLARSTPDEPSLFLRFLNDNYLLLSWIHSGSKLIGPLHTIDISNCEISIFKCHLSKCKVAGSMFSTKAGKRKASEFGSIW